MNDLKKIIEEAFERRAEITPRNAEAHVSEAVNEVIHLLDAGKGYAAVWIARMLGVETQGLSPEEAAEQADLVARIVGAQRVEEGIGAMAPGVHPEPSGNREDPVRPPDDDRPRALRFSALPSVRPPG